MTEPTAQQRAEMRAAAVSFVRSWPEVGGLDEFACRVIALLDLCDRLERLTTSSWRCADAAELLQRRAEAALAAEREHASALAAALEPFARWAKDWSEEDDDEGYEIDPLLSMDDRAASASDLRRAASVLDAHRAREGGGG